MKEVLASWTAEFQHESAFTPIRQLYDNLRKEGISFVIQVNQNCLVMVILYLFYVTQPQPSSSSTTATTQQSAGEDDIAKAIRLSLEEANKLSSKSSNSSLYPSLSASQPSRSTTTVSNVVSSSVICLYAHKHKHLSFHLLPPVFILAHYPHVMRHPPGHRML